MNSKFKAGEDFIGLGVGAMVFNQAGDVFMARRSSGVRNEAGTWEFPGGAVEFGEPLVKAVQREFCEEYAMQVEVEAILGIFDHILPTEGQHWVSVTYIANQKTGIPEIREPDKCDEIAWFSLHELPRPMSIISRVNLRRYISRLSHDAIDER